MNRPLVRHLAVTTSDPAELAKFYVDVLEMELISGRPGDMERYLTDGYIMLALLYQKLERSEARRGVNHFGFQVASRSEIAQRIAAVNGREPKARPATIPFAEFRGVDPEGNAFDLSEQGFLRSKMMTDELAARYASTLVQATSRPTMRHIGIYVQDPEKVAQFYVDALGMQRLPALEGDTTSYVTDGYFTLALFLYRLEGASVNGLNHYGFSVTAIAEIAKRITDRGVKEPKLRAPTRPFDTYRAVDPEGNWFDLIEYGVATVRPEPLLEHAHA
jgi:catechol 2,3-dioxygenase-like lactoylglutathione lyase family enzyme